VATYYDKGVFAVLFEKPKLDQTLRTIEQIRVAAMKHPVTVDEKTTEFTISLGVARGVAGENVKQMLQRADDASRAAVTEGGNQIFISNGKEVQPLNLTVLK
jgi:PleD family two-component response regulator